ncbi:signal recognition particle 19 kDa protein isoform X3 [Brachypodium distachyon]|uniref:Signal recognition particle 19 kDa protein n=1 Tax=Brachypodium distachyon TaxID=15368 RepID=I1J103_BRADI|nr:signal recognition particle 19 kDa protein isoform X3 [Brachypodium distachyon]KQJ84229.1 hypothetical protein BRADI_5g19500v3 [Brachypodium distachyon]KQJ84231.1 hypothetical protein BRADI_5g19500v3 [Brachypodium distachyon]|eukprot:XP_024311212.1 signal recognition particle 19 kDa protein isoform X3 [Brachypodium distachyon]
MDVGGRDGGSSIKKWDIIYPVYLNSKKTVAEGRRIAAAKACADPTCNEILDSCAYLKIPCKIEVLMYSAGQGVSARFLSEGEGEGAAQE